MSLVILPASSIQLTEVCRVKVAVALKNRVYVKDLLSHSVDNAVSAQAHFPAILSLRFGDHAAREWGRAACWARSHKRLTHRVLPRSCHGPYTARWPADHAMKKGKIGVGLQWYEDSSNLLLINGLRILGVDRGLSWM